MHYKKRIILITALLLPVSQVLWAEQVDGGIEGMESDLGAPAAQQEPSIQADSDTEEETIDAAAFSTEGGSAQAVETTDAVETTETAENTEVAETTEVAEAREAAEASEVVEEVTETVETADVAESTEERESVETQVADDTSAQAAPKMQAAPDDISGSMKDHWKAREAQYEALRKRAEDAGVMLPERPPWYPGMGQMTRPGHEERMAHRKEMMSMSAEERDAYRQQRHEEMRARAEEMGMEVPEMPPWKARQQAMDEEWAKHQQVIQGMSEEERAACQAMHRRHMRMMHGGRGGQGCGGMGHQGCGMQRDNYRPRMMQDYGTAPGQGYGYGPGPYYGPGPQNFWDPNQ